MNLFHSGYFHHFPCCFVINRTTLQTVLHTHIWNSDLKQRLELEQPIGQSTQWLSHLCARYCHASSRDGSQCTSLQALLNRPLLHLAGVRQAAFCSYIIFTLHVGIIRNLMVFSRRIRIVVSTPRCGRGNPGSNPGMDMVFSFLRLKQTLASALIQFFFIPL